MISRCCWCVGRSFLILVLTLATPLALVAIAELASLVGTGGSTGRNDGAVEASLGDNVDLNGRAATGVVDGACVDLGDRHLDCSKKGRLMSVMRSLGGVWKELGEMLSVEVVIGIADDGSFMTVRLRVISHNLQWIKLGK